MSAVCRLQTDKSIVPPVFVCLARDDYPEPFVHIANMADEDRNYLRAWREAKGLTQEELADKVGTTKAVISLLENEKRPLSSKWLRKFGDALGTTPGRILDVDPKEVSAEVLNIWDHIAIEDRPRAVRILRSLTGTDD